MIISASYKTDIPAFYSPWLFQRIRAGYCMVRNPYGGKPFRVDLSPSAVDGWVFWTRNFGPMLPRAAQVREPFAVQFTITGYDNELERSVLPADAAVSQMREIRSRFGPRAAVWRYDTILFTARMDARFHCRNFRRLAGELRGTTDEAVISFAQIYRKTRLNLQRGHVAWRDPSDDEKRALAAELARIAGDEGITVTVCSQAAYTMPETRPAQCIDAARLSDIAQRPLRARVKGNRPDCACHESRDIGEYDTCPQGCLYCYAVSSRALALRNLKHHNPESEYLATRSIAATMLP